MKTKTLLTFLFCLFTLVSGVQVSAQEKEKQKDKDQNKETVELYVPDMHCKNCQNKIEKNIAYEKGVTDIKVDLENKVVTINYKKNKTTVEKIQAAFKKLGYLTEIVANKSK